MPVIHYQGPSGTIRDWRFGEKKPFEPKKYFGLCGLCGLEAAGGSRGGPTLSWTTRDRRLGQKEPFEPKKICRPLRPLEGPGGPDTVRDHQGSTLRSKGTIWAKKNFRPWLTFASLWRPPEAIPYGVSAAGDSLWPPSLVPHLKPRLDGAVRLLPQDDPIIKKGSQKAH